MKADSTPAKIYMQEGTLGGVATAILIRQKLTDEVKAINKANGKAVYKITQTLESSTAPFGDISKDELLMIFRERIQKQEKLLAEAGVVVMLPIPTLAEAPAIPAEVDLPVAARPSL